MKNLHVTTLYFLLYLTISSAGLYYLKKATGIFSWTFIAGFFLYANGFIIWIAILRQTPLSIAFPIAAGGLIISTQIIGYTLFKENVNTIQIIAIALIFTGITLLHLKSG